MVLIVPIDQCMYMNAALTRLEICKQGDIPKTTDASQQGTATQHKRLVCDDVMNIRAREYALFSSKVN